MAGYGSKAKPVEQDPFQQIVEVHWSPKYLAIGIDVDFSVQIGDPLPNFSVIGPPFVYPFTHRYLVSLDPAGDPSIFSAQVGNGNNWSSVLVSEIEATGLPSLGSVSVGSWQWTVDDASGIKGPFHQWEASSGIDGPYVEGPSGVFNEGLDPSVALKGQKFLEGAPYWSPGFSNVGQWGTGESTGADLSVPTITDISSLPFSLADLSIVYKDKTWRPIASKVLNVVGYNEGSLMVLLKREDVTA